MAVSGKATYATALAAESGTVRFCPDESMHELHLDL